MANLYSTEEETGRREILRLHRVCQDNCKEAKKIIDMLIALLPKTKLKLKEVIEAKKYYTI